MTTEQAQMPLFVLLEKGLDVFNKITAQAVSLNKQEMIDLLNFEIAVRHVIKIEKEATAKVAA